VNEVECRGEGRVIWWTVGVIRKEKKENGKKERGE
jgi:hypothetical protein